MRTPADPALALASFALLAALGCGGPGPAERGSVGSAAGGTSGGSVAANTNRGGGPGAASTGGGGSLALPTVRADGTVVIGPGFAPTPIILGGTAGGSVDASTLSSTGTLTAGYGCIGMMPSAPQHVLEVTGSMPHLRIVVDTYVAGAGGSSDTTLMVRLPDGSLWCDDDGGGELQPMVEGAVTRPGRVEVFVGGYSTSGVGARYKVALTESYDYTHYAIRGVAAPSYPY